MADVVFRGKNVVFPLQSARNDRFVLDENASLKTEKQNLSIRRHGDTEEKLECVLGGK